MQETPVWSLGQEEPLEKKMATHSSTLAWRIPWTEEPGLPSMGQQTDTTVWLNFTFFQQMLLTKITLPTCSLHGGSFALAIPRLHIQGLLPSLAPHCSISMHVVLLWKPWGLGLYLTHTVYLSHSGPRKIDKLMEYFS